MNIALEAQLVAQDIGCIQQSVLCARTATCRNDFLTVMRVLADAEEGDVLVIDSAPHDWLFPYMAAVVHHGGAGTTAAGLRAGRPSVLVPFFGDQPYWGHRVHALSAGPEPILRSELTAKRLADAIIEAVTDQAIQSQATTLGENIRAEDGVANAVEIINRFFWGW